MLQPADATAPAAGTRNPLEDEMAGGTMPADPVLAERGASVPAGPPAVTEYGTRPGSVTYEALPGSGGTAAEAGSDLPTIDDVALQGGVPEMHIDLHVYSANPQERFVFVNKRKYREGETLQEGPRVERDHPRRGGTEPSRAAIHPAAPVKAARSVPATAPRRETRHLYWRLYD